MVVSETIQEFVVGESYAEGFSGDGLQIFSLKRKFSLTGARSDLVKATQPVKKSSRDRAGTEQSRVIVVGDTFVSEHEMAGILKTNKRYHVCGGAYGFTMPAN
jgi:hypothetical protein